MGSINTLSDLFNTNMLIPVLVLSVANGFLLFFASLKFLLVLQQGGYRYKRYFKWLKNPETPYLSRLMLLCLLGILFFCVITLTFSPIIGNKDVIPFSGLVSYVSFVLMYIKSESSVNAKVPLKKTQRLVRLAITFIVLLSLSTFGLFVLLNHIALIIGDEMVALLRYSLISAMPILSPFILFIAYCINEPFEEILRRYYINLAKTKLSKSSVIKVGITGSYGKTGVKEILKTILSQKFRVLSTPRSFNTPMGIALTVKNLEVTHDIFLAEMGARQKGDIKELVNLVHPDYGILTGVNNQHLESFKSIENIKNTKYELFENLSKSAIFSSDNPISVELSKRYQKEKYLAGISGENNLVFASDVSLDNTGTTFTLNIKGEKPIKCKTVLLGKHSVSNICLASALCYKLGMSVEEIAQGINRIKTTFHRLELLPNNKNIVIIDDSYNSNQDGTVCAMEVLDTFKGRKIVVTPGLVELGKIENVANFELGKTLSKHADVVIVVGKHNAEMLVAGLKEGGLKTENIYFSRNLSRGNDVLNTILKEGDVVLFENDLPDNYS